MRPNAVYIEDSLRSNRRSRRTALALALAGMGLGVTMSVQAQSAVAPFTLPAPSGPFAIGTTSWHITDSARPDGFTTTGAPRAVEVVAWYPTARESARLGSRAEYLRESIAEVQAFASLLRQPGAYDSLAAVRTHATLNAKPLPGNRRLPLLLFSHGYTGVASAYTSLLEELASYGYVVFSIVHPYEVAAATLPIGDVVSFLGANGALRAGSAAVQAEWSQEDAMMSRVTDERDDNAQLRVLRAYLRGLTQTNVALERWVADTKLVLDRLPTLRRGTVGRQLATLVNEHRVGVFGHSFGGVTAGEFCLNDVRCAAGLNLDGIPQYGAMIDATMSRPFLMVYSARPGRVGASDVIYRRAVTRYYRVDVADTRHLDFSDMKFWGGPLKSFGAFGTITPERAASVTRQIVREYFDQELRGKPSALLNGTRVEASVRVTRTP